MMLAETEPRADATTRTMTAPAGDLSDDPRIVAALEEYCRLDRHGRRPNRAEFLARHAEIALALADCLDGLDMVEGAADVLDGPAPAPEEPDERLRPGARLGDFRIVREVGRGGMGVVYEAEQSPPGRRVALKVLPTAGALDPRQRQRFQVEAHAAAVLQHPNIVPVYAVGSDRGIPYYAMQFIAGRSLAEVLRELRPGAGAPPAPAGSSGSSLAHRDRRYCRSVARLGVQAAEALEHAHAVGIVHRDIKPSNLLVDGQGRLWIADFGLAHVAGDDAGLTRTGDVIGTLRYMSPEQLRGGRSVVGPRTDVYSLGLTLWELLTLRAAFDHDDRSRLVHAILNEDPPAPRRLNPSIPRDLETILLKAIAKEPAGRYASARALADDLQWFLDDQPIRARRPGPLGRVARWTRRHRQAVGAVAAVLVVALAVGAGLLWRAQRDTASALDAERDARMRERLAFELSFGTLDQILLGPDDGPAGVPRGMPSHVVAISYYDRIAHTFRDDRSMREVTAKAHQRAGDLRLRHGQGRGRRDYDRAIGLYEQVAAEHPDRIFLRTELINLLLDYANRLAALDDAEGADGATRRALLVADGLADDPRAAVPCFRTGLVGPFDALARGLAERPQADPADVARAVRLARTAVDWAPEPAGGWITLALAHLRAGQRNRAADALAEVTRREPADDPRDLLALALIGRGLGRDDEARRWLDRADARLGDRPAPGLLALRNQAGAR